VWRSLRKRTGIQKHENSHLRFVACKHRDAAAGIEEATDSICPRDIPLLTKIIVSLR
jgi:hypothetical protein